MVQLNGKTVLVSGSSRGIGKGIARTFLEKGARVCINGREQDSLGATVDELVTAFGEDRVHSVCVDVTTTQGVIEALDALDLRWGKPDIVVANVGSGRTVDGWDIDDDEWSRMMEVNLHGTIRLCREAIRRMTDGAITMIASIAGCEATGAPTPYTVAKAALLAYVKSTADQLGIRGIRVNSVSPGNVMFAGSTWDQKLADDREGVLAMIADKVPLDDFASTSDIGEAVAWLSSDDARFVTGVNLVVDGGQLRGLK